MNRENNEVLLQDIVLSYKSHWLPEYQKDISFAQCAGIMLANLLKWNGLQIMEAAGDALEDANFHKEANIVRELLEINKR